MNRLNNKSGVVLVVVLIAVGVLLVLTSIYFSSVLTDRISVDRHRYSSQALGLAESGAAHALAELRKRVRIDLKNRVEDPSGHWTSSTFSGYVSANDALGFLRDFAYASGDTQFSVASGKATLTVNSPALGTGIAGTYVATITITPNGAPTNPSSDIYIFPYAFTIGSQGTVNSTTPSLSREVKLWQGRFSVTVRRDNFAKFALFTSHHSTPSGGVVWFTENTNFTGPVSTNERFSFANNPSGHFTDEVTQHENRARYYNNGSSILRDDDHNGTRDVPVFDRGFTRGYGLINLPSSITQNDLRTESLGTMSVPGTNGIYVPNSGGATTGGIYVRGTSTINMSVDGSNNAVYTITQGTTTNTITVDRTNNQTRVFDGTTTVTYSGLPDGVSNEGILIYTTNDITSFSGTVQKDSCVTVSSERDIVISNNVLYEKYTASPLSGNDPDTGLPASNMLGILAWGGDVRIGTTAPNNVQIHGVIMAPHGVFEVDNYDSGAPRGTATLLGGAITDFYGPFGQFSGTTPTHGYGRNFVYDARVLSGQTPPYFPYLSGFTISDDNNIDNKLVWEGEGV